MLLLTRNIGQSLVIGDDVVITLISVDQNQVKVGIDAPCHISVHRSEVYKRIQAENGVTNSRLLNRITNKFSERRVGCISDIKPDKGYGFIYCSGIDNLVFFHASDLSDSEFSSLQPGDDLNFLLKKSAKGLSAFDIKKVS